MSAALGIDLSPDGPIAIRGVRLEIAQADGGDASRGADRLEVVGSEPPLRVSTAPGGAAAREAGARVGLVGGDPARPEAWLLALGWATVDLERAAAEWAGIHAAAWAGVHWAPAARDSAVGGRVLVRDGARPRRRAGVTGPARAGADPDVARAARAWDPGAGFVIPAPRGLSAPRGLPAPRVPIALLEPDTEGRLAAALARHGEGPAVLYLGVPSAGVSAARARLSARGIVILDGSGPFGPELVVAGSPAWGPTLIVVPVEVPVAPVRRKSAGRAAPG